VVTPRGSCTTRCVSRSFTEEQLEALRWGAALHDIGKIGVDDSILKKPAPLEEDEWQAMRRHPEMGFDLMNDVEGDFAPVIEGMRFHHERWDGGGYPSGLKGEQIPWMARIISVADTYDAMVSTRPYRKGMDPKFAHDEIVKNSGTQFAPEVVEAFRFAFANDQMGRASRPLAPL
jgi:HD-GYP domain-containing protein (c-di-GMP phosphodiesterase class II)